MVKTFLIKKGIDTVEIPPAEYNGNKYYSNEEKAHILNDFFVKQSSLEHEDDKPSVLPQLDCHLHDIVLSVSK